MIVGERVWWCFVIFQPSTTSKNECGTPCQMWVIEYHDIGVTVFLYSLFLWTTGLTYSRIVSYSYFLTRFRKGVPFKHLKRSEETLGDAINIAELQRLDGLPSNVLAIQTFIVIPASADLKSATLPNRIIWDLISLFQRSSGQVLPAFSMSKNPFHVLKNATPNNFAKTGPITILSPKPIRVKWKKDT